MAFASLNWTRHKNADLQHNKYALTLGTNTKKPSFHLPGATWSVRDPENSRHWYCWQLACCEIKWLSSRAQPCVIPSLSHLWQSFSRHSHKPLVKGPFCTAARSVSLLLLVLKQNFIQDNFFLQWMVMGSSASFLLIGGELICIQLKKEKKKSMSVQVLTSYCW